MNTVDESEWDQYDLWRAAPNYGDGVYDTTLCNPSVQELRLYNSLNSKSDQQVSQIVNEMESFDIDLDDEDMDQDVFDKWCEVKLKPPPKKLSRFIDLAHFATYNQVRIKLLCRFS